MTESIMGVNDKKLSKKSSEIIDLFLDSLWMERGLSKNTLSAYRSDLNKFFCIELSLAIILLICICFYERHIKFF